MNPLCSRESVTDVKSSPGSENSASYSPDSEVSNFSSSQEALFRKRYEEGYDLPDPVYRQWLAINHPEGSKSSGSMITHVSDSQTVHSSSSTPSDVLSDILKLPEPQLPKRKRKPGFNTGKAVAITDNSFVIELKGKEIEKQRRKEEQEKKRKEARREEILGRNKKADKKKEYNRKAKD